jgi:hypothetical protein
MAEHGAGAASRSRTATRLNHRSIVRTWLDPSRKPNGERIRGKSCSRPLPDGNARTASGFPIPFLPATEQAECFRALTTQSRSVDEDRRADHQLTLRLEGDQRVRKVRTALLDRLLPIPEDLPTVEQLECFRRRHGEKLPTFRRHLEERIDRTALQADEVLWQREIDRIAEGVEELIEEVEAYLTESGFRIGFADPRCSPCCKPLLV